MGRAAGWSFAPGFSKHYPTVSRILHAKQSGSPWKRLERRTCRPRRWMTSLLWHMRRQPVTCRKSNCSLSHTVPCHAGVGRRTSASVMCRSSVSIFLLPTFHHAPEVTSALSRRGCAPVIHAWKAASRLSMASAEWPVWPQRAAKQHNKSPAIII